MEGRFQHKLRQANARAPGGIGNRQRVTPSDPGQDDMGEEEGTATPFIDKNIENQNAILAAQKAARATHENILSGHYQYPAHLGTGRGDLLNWMKFQAYEISGGFSGNKMVKFSSSGKGYAALPVPAGIQATYDQSWNQSTVSAKSQTMARAATGLTGGGIANFIRGEGFGEDMSMDAIKSRFGDQFGAMSFGQEGTAAILQKTGMAETMQFTMGMRALDQVMMSYGGPAFRNFNFSFALKPLNVADTEMVNAIVRFFKLASAPMLLNTAMTRLYELPAVFEISFYNGSRENLNLPKIGKCALTNVGVSYGGDKFTTFDETGGAPVQADLTLQFKEMELLDRDNFVGNDF